MPRLPSVLHPPHLPLPELMAARLDGELFALEAGHCPVDEVEHPELRLTALLAEHAPRFIAELGSAAWVWGAMPVPPPVLELCVDLRARARPRAAPHERVREVVLGVGDVLELGGRRVTSPLRTAVDLARAREPFGEGDRDAVRALAGIGAFGLREALAHMNATRNLPGKRRATERLQSALSPR